MIFKVGDKVRFTKEFIKTQEGQELNISHIKKRLEERTIEDISPIGEIRLFKNFGCWFASEYFEPINQISESELKELNSFLKQYEVLKKIWI